MKKFFSIITIRKVATFVVVIVASIFIGFISYLYVAYRNVLSASVHVTDNKELLTNFDTSKFDNAVLRLQKRRNLAGPAENIRDPFGDIPQ